MWSAACNIPTPELVTAPATEPVTLTELKAHVRQDFTDDDTFLTSLGVAARQWFENALDRFLVTQTWKIRLPSFPAYEIELPYPPLQSATITYKDSLLATQTLATAAYTVITNRTPGVVQLNSGYAWPVTGIDPFAVTIQFVAGYGVAAAVPELVKAGIKLLVKLWYEEAAITGGLTTDQMNSIAMSLDRIVHSMRAYRF